MKDPWEKAYVYGRIRGQGSRAAHVIEGHPPYYGRLDVALCLMSVDYLSPSASPLPVCKRCLCTKRAKELGL